MDPKKMPASRLMVSSVLEPRDEIDEKLERAYNIIHQLTNGFTLSERESNDTLQTHVAKGQAPHDETVLGLFYSILVDPKTAVKCYRDMAFVARDGLLTAISKTNQLVHEKWTKLLDTPRTQLLWFSKELVRSNNRGAESVCHTLIRQIAGGDISLKNIWLTEAVLDILAEHRAWLDKHPPLIAGAIYTYLRVIVDHTAAPFEQLKQRETDFCVSLLRDKWTEALVIGRDLVRLLQYVARIPEFDKLWKDILHNPTALSPTFTGIPQLMMTRTPRWLIASRLTPDMENKLVFLTTKVRFGQQKRYQDWFQRQYLATPESQSLRWDLIRYICAVIHPSNEVLCSDIIPRWAVIGWLLTTCTSNVAASNAKLSLFYDWLYFDPEKDSIMNIEPCILVMHHSMRPHPAITATLLDFMCRIMFNFYPPYITRVKQGIFTALRTILEKRVLPSLSPLFDNPKLDKDLRVMIRENFIEFCSQEVKDEPAMGNNNVGGSGAGEIGMEIDPSSHLIDGSMMLDIAEFSDEEEEDPAPDIKQQPEIKFRPIKESIRMATVDISEHLIPLDPEIRQCVIDFKEETENEIQCEMMDRLVQAIISCHVNQGEYDQEMAAATAMCLTQLLAPYFTGQLYPTEPDEESIEDSIGSPLYVIFRNVCQTPEDDPARQPILILLEEMYLKQPRLGYHFLYFLKVSKVHDEKMAAYRDFCNSMENKDIATCLMDDLRYCAGDDVRLFTFLIPDVYTLFPNIAIGNTDMLQLIVSHIDGTQLQDLVCQILQGHLIMFRKDSFLNVLNASLEWETIEQYFLWQLISAHSIPVEHIMPILPKLEFNTHAEALASVLVLLKQDGPCGELMRPLLCRECKKYDLFTVSILKFWAQEYEDKLADLLYAQLTRSASTPNRKRKGSQSQSTPKMKDKDAPTVEQVLAHLEHMRQTCRNISFLMHESLQQGLQHVQVTATESLKNKFSELLALAEDIDDYNRNTRVLRAVPSRRASSAAGHLHAKVSMPPTSSPPKKNKVEKIDSDSETSSSDDEEIMRPPKAKKRKKVIAVDDDSD